MAGLLVFQVFNRCTIQLQAHLLGIHQELIHKENVQLIHDVLDYVDCDEAF